MRRILFFLPATAILLSTPVLPLQPSTPTSRFNASAVAGAVEAVPADEDKGTVVAPSLVATNAEVALFDATNNERAQVGVAALAFSDGLHWIARARAESQLRESSLTHLDASGRLAFAQLMRDAGVPFDLAGENLARVPAPTSNAAERADYFLMQSPPHRANILDPRYTSIAIGSAIDARGNVVFAQIFHTGE